MCASDRQWGLAKPALLALVLALSHTGVWAQADKEAEQLKRLRLQVRQSQQQLQQAQETLAQTEQARQRAEASQKAQDQALSRHKGVAEAAGRRAGSLARELDLLKGTLSTTQTELQALKAQHLALSESAERARAQAADAEARWRAQVSQLQAQLQRARQDNAVLADLGLELLERYEHKGLREVLSANEPFVQTGRVRLENLKASYQGRIDAARQGPAQQAPTAAPEGFPTGQKGLH